jgi:hypothetical protein
MILSDRMWRFVRGNEPERDFESWLYANHEDAELETLLGKDLVQAALATDYGDVRQIIALRQSLERALVGGPSCRCISWRDDQRSVLGLDEMQRPESLGDFLSAFLVLKRRTPWLYAVQCRRCDRLWYLGVDSIDDEYYLHLLNTAERSQILAGRWPDVFDRISALWPTKEWLALHGYSSLEGWQARNADAPPEHDADGKRK